MKKKKVLALLVSTALLVTGCSSSGDKASDAPVVVTLWHNLGDTQNAEATKALTDAYTAAHPNVTFNLVSQPGDNYFSLLQAAAVSKTGPDLVLMWTGLFALKYKEYLTNLKGLVSDGALARQGSLEWSSDDFNIDNDTKMYYLFDLNYNINRLPYTEVTLNTLLITQLVSFLINLGIVNLIKTDESIWNSLFNN